MFTRQDLVAQGLPRAEIDQRCAQAQQLTRGLYVLDGEDHYGARCQAVLASIRGGVLAGPSAAFWWGLPLLTRLEEVTLRGVPRGRWARGVRVLDGPAEFTTVSEIPVTTPAWTVVDCARLLAARDGLVVADAALNRGLCTLAELQEVSDRVRRRTGASLARWVVDNADAGAESPGESWMRMVVCDLGYDAISQVHICAGEFEAYIDLMLDEHTGLEFDGMVKYQHPSSVMREKIRQAGVEELGLRLLRVVWPQLSDPDGLDRRIQVAGVRRVRRRRIR